ncbi:permease [Marinobacter sp. M-5]|uniref:permease n=1 Tax=Marinobacter sp. M-5 TaxID=3081089 RepID=UPI00293CFE6D|nr:permease [Marinobacter sp. M-5]MDV3504265.1 permease [Marinobacter sp. M-5]
MKISYLMDVSRGKISLNGTTAQRLNRIWKDFWVWLASLMVVTLLAMVDPDQAQAQASVIFAATALMKTAPFLVLSIVVAAWASATGADNLIARAFTGAPGMMILMGAIAGGISPFCSCGVIPLIAALLAMGVPLSAVMAFWLASPVMDPSMFALTTGVLGLEFAIGKTLAAIGLGLFGGWVARLVGRIGGLAEPLREGIGNGGCGGSKVRAPKPVVWRFWAEPERRARFGREASNITLFLAKWLVLAFLLESLILAFVPVATITSVLGGEGIGPIALGTLVGVPAYLNGYAALPLVGGLIAQGMAPGAGLAFLVAGGVTSLPAALAVWALVKPRVFGLYIALALIGAFLSGLLFQLWSLT